MTRTKAPSDPIEHELQRLDFDLPRIGFNIAELDELFGPGDFAEPLIDIPKLSEDSDIAVLFGTGSSKRGTNMATKPEKQSSSIKRGGIDFDLALPDFSIPDKDIAKIDASLASFASDLPGIGFDFAELDELLGLVDLPDLPLDLPAIRSRDPGESPKNARKNARTRDMGYRGEGARKSKPVCGAKTRKGTPCKAPGNGRGGRCKLHGGKSSGPKTPEGKIRSLVALRSRHARRPSNNCTKTGPSPLKQQRRLPLTMPPDPSWGMIT